MRDVTGEMQSTSTKEYLQKFRSTVLHVIERPCLADCVLIFHADIDAPLHEVSSAICCFSRQRGGACGQIVCCAVLRALSGVKEHVQRRKREERRTSGAPSCPVQLRRRGVSVRVFTRHQHCHSQRENPHFGAGRIPETKIWFGDLAD